MGRISLPLALLGMQAMLGAVVDARSNIHFTLLGVQAMLGMVAEAQYNVYYGYTAQELQEFIADTVLGCFFSFLYFPVLHFSFFPITGDRNGCGRIGLQWGRLPLQVNQPKKK